MPRRKWCWDSACAEAGKYTTVRAFKYGSIGAYKWAERNGVLKDVKLYLAGRRKPNGYWSEERCMGIALGYESLSDFLANEPDCYKRASENGFLHKITAHMDRSQAGGDNDAAYGWLVTAANDEVVVPLPGYHLVKFGVTSQRCGNQRPMQTMKANNMQGEIIAIRDTETGQATKVEGVLLTLGTDAGIPYWYDGKTEFRLISDRELNEARALLGA